MSETARYLIQTLVRCGAVTTSQLNKVSASRFGAGDREKWRRHVFAELRKLHRRSAVMYGRRRGHHRTWTATEFGRLMLEENKGNA